MDELMEDPRITSVRLVTNPERMVLRETQRAFVYFSLHGLTVDWLIANRVLPFAAKGEVGLFKKGDELVVEIGTLRRHIGLPTSMVARTPSRAKLDNKELTVEMKEAPS